MKRNHLYVKNSILFADKVQVINKVNSKTKMGNILLDNFEKLVTEMKIVSFVQQVLFGYYLGLPLLFCTRCSSMAVQSAHPGQ